MRIAMIGAGYVGLVSGACLADFGHDVTVVDNHGERIAALRDGRMPIYEPGLGELVAGNVAAGRLSFATDMADAVAGAAVVFIAVGTPSRRGDGFADLSYVHAAAEEIAACLDGFTVVVTKSTVPVGTADEVERRIARLTGNGDFAVVSNPEFLREGAAINDFKRPDRVVIGTDDAAARDIMAEVYRPLFLNQTPILFTSRRSAELIKYAANAFLAMKITFINEMADLCERVGGDVQDIARGIGMDGRIGAKFLHAGPGFGGSCFPKDTRALALAAENAGSPLNLVETVIKVNEARKRAMARRVIAACGGSVRDKRICILGVTFKPNTDDVRDSPALSIMPILAGEGASLACHDPQGMEEARIGLDGLTVDWIDDPYAAMAGADAVVIVTEWDSFRALDLARMKDLVRTPVLVDLRNIYQPGAVAAAGFTYHGIGRAQTGA